MTAVHLMWSPFEPDAACLSCTCYWARHTNTPASLMLCHRGEQVHACAHTHTHTQTHTLTQMGEHARCTHQHAHTPVYALGACALLGACAHRALAAYTSLVCERADRLLGGQPVPPDEPQPPGRRQHTKQPGVGPDAQHPKQDRVRGGAATQKAGIANHVPGTWGLSAQGVNPGGRAAAAPGAEGVTRTGGGDAGVGEPPYNTLDESIAGGPLARILRVRARAQLTHKHAHTHAHMHMHSCACTRCLAITRPCNAQGITFTYSRTRMHSLARARPRLVAPKGVLQTWADCMCAC